MKKYPKTPQQVKVKVGGELIKLVCTGKKGELFRRCRSIVLRCAFKDEECDAQLLDLKREIIEKD